MDNSSTERKPRLRQIQKEQTRDIILDAARVLFYKHDVGNVSVSQIVEEAGVGRQTFYFHFRDKDEVISRLVDEYNIRGAEVMLKFPAGQSEKTEIREWLFEFSHFLEDVKAEYSILFQLSHHPKTKTAYGQPTAETWVGALGQRSPSFAVATRGDDEGERARAEAWRLLMDVTWAATVAWQYRGSVFADEVVNNVVDLLHAFTNNPKYRSLPKV